MKNYNNLQYQIFLIQILCSFKILQIFKAWLQVRQIKQKIIKIPATTKCKNINIVHKTGKSESQALQTLAASNPQQRLVQAHEVAQSVLWLCAQGSDAINGQAIAIDGGEMAG